MANMEKHQPTLRDIKNGLALPQPPPMDDVHGEEPDINVMDIHDLSEQISEDDKLTEIANQYTSEHPKIIDKAKEMGNDVVAYVHKNKKGFIYIGTGVAAVFGIAGYVIYRHHKIKPGKKE
jgi:hypothetical protein